MPFNLIFFFLNEILIVANVLWWKSSKKGGEDPPQALKTCFIAAFCVIIALLELCFLLYSPSLLPSILSSIVIPTVSSVEL